MTTDKLEWTLRENKDRRSGIDRRHFSYSCHIPERRRGIEELEGTNDRRCGSDRRTGEAE